MSTIGYSLVFFGGGMGAISRFYLSQLIATNINTTFPVGTLVVNLLGAFIIGFLIEIATTKLPLTYHAKLLIITGFLGGFTTFSAFSLESVLMLQKSQYLILGSYIFISVFGSLLLLLLGKNVVKYIF